MNNLLYLRYPSFSADNVFPCNPSPCGPNSQCREIQGQAICSCLIGYRGSPPTCRPECVTSSECALNRACSNQKCIDPCKGNCGVNAICQVINHNPICSCPSGFGGNPFSRCVLEGNYYKFNLLVNILTISYCVLNLKF